MNSAGFARKGPAAAPSRVAAASQVRKTAQTRPRTAPGITRCKQVSGITSAIDPNMPITTAAGSAAPSPWAVNSPKYPAAVAIKLAASSTLG